MFEALLVVVAADPPEVKAPLSRVRRWGLMYSCTIDCADGAQHHSARWELGILVGTGSLEACRSCMFAKVLTAVRKRLLYKNEAQRCCLTL